MVYYPSCRTRDIWAQQLEKEFDAFLGKLPRDVDRARALESLAEALDTVLRMECERLPPTPGRGQFGQGEKAEYGVLPLIPLALTVAPVIAEKVAPVIAEKLAGVFTGAEFSQIGALLRTVAPIIGKAVAKEVTPIIVQKVFGSVGPGASFQQLPGVQKVFDSRILLVLMTKDIPSLEEIAQEVPQDVRLTEREKDLLRRLIERQIEQVRSAPLEFGQVGREVGAAVGGPAAAAAVTAAGAPGLTPVVAPIGAAVGAEVGARVQREAERRSQRYGALAEFSAIFRGREAATNLARTYQSNGISSFVYFDPVAFTPAPVTEVRRVPIFDPETGELLEEMEARPVPVPEIDPETGQPRRGVWRVEIGIPTEAERELVRVGKIRVVPPGEKVPADPRRQIFLEFPPAPVAVMGAILERPTLLDALVDSEFGAILVAGAAEKAPCDCVSLPPEGKLLCTREGAIGSLSQVQVQRNCSEIRPAADGRLARAQALREGQAVCGALVEGIADIGERFATRFTCLQELLAGRGISS